MGYNPTGSVVGFFFFFCYDRCLKGCGSWLGLVFGSLVMVWVWCLGRGWVVAEVGCRLGSIDGGFEMVDLLIGGWIGWVDHR